MCREVLEDTWAAREVLDLSTMPKPPTAQWIPDMVWSTFLAATGPFAEWVTVGLYDESVRELMGYTWSPIDERLHWVFGRGVNLAFKFLPRRRRMHPRARAGWDRAEGRLPADAPLPQTRPATSRRSRSGQGASTTARWSEKWPAGRRRR